MQDVARGGLNNSFLALGLYILLQADASDGLPVNKKQSSIEEHIFLLIWRCSVKAVPSLVGRDAAPLKLPLVPTCVSIESILYGL